MAGFRFPAIFSQAAQGVYPNLKNRYLEAGKIVNTHGITGEVKVIPWCDEPEFLLDFDTFYLDGSPVKVLSARVHKNSVLLTLEGISTINDAMKLKDKILWIDRKDADLPEGRHFIADLMGLEVRDASTGTVLGVITDVLTPPAHEVYVVKGAQEHLIPAVDEFVLETNVEDGYLWVRLIEGM